MVSAVSGPGNPAQTKETTMTPQDFDKYSDLIDSRDVIARIKELEEVKTDEPEQWSSDFQAELDALLALQSEAEGSPDWEHGETLIRDSYFRDYAMELAEDIGAIDHNARWPQTCIDWGQAAHQLRMDYISVDFDGVTYWIRG